MRHKGLKLFMYCTLTFGYELNDTIKTIMCPRLLKITETIVKL